MKSKLYTGNTSDSLIVFFAGWGMDTRPFLHLNSEESDVMILYDYRNIELPAYFSKTISMYKKVSFIAWSFGVWVCAHCIPKLPENTQRAIAIAGTLYPSHDAYGISPRILKATLKNYSEDTRDSFYTRMCGDENTHTCFLAVAPDRTIESQKSELEFLLNEFEEEEPPDNIFTHAIICAKDMSFPAHHQRNFWHSDASREIATAHFPFFTMSSWNDIIRYGYDN